MQTLGLFPFLIFLFFALLFFFIFLSFFSIAAKHLHCTNTTYLFRHHRHYLWNIFLVIREPLSPPIYRLFRRVGPILADSHPKALWLGTLERRAPFPCQNSRSNRDSGEPCSQGTSIQSASSAALPSFNMNSSTSFGSSLSNPQMFNQQSSFGSTFTSPSASIGFSFGASASSTPSAPTNAARMLFNPSSSASLSSPAASASAPNTRPVFGNTQPVFGNPSMTGFGAGASSPGKNDEMNAEDSMAEDPVQSSSVAVFGQPSSSVGFAFGSTAPSQPSNPFMFGGSQQNQNQPPFQASGSLEFKAGGSFSLGSGGGDKSGRKNKRK